MKKVALVLLLSMPLFGASVEQEKAATVLISNESFGGVGRGTGVLLDATHVLTCAHMMQGARDNFFIYTYPLGTVLQARPLVTDGPDDLMLMELSSSATFKNDLVIQETIHDGEPITVIGNALGGMKWFVSKGVISGEDGGNLLTDALVNPGNSGGGWWNDKGELVGLTDWRIGPDDEHHVPGFSGGISGKRIKGFLEAYHQMLKMQDMLNKIMGGNADAHVFVIPR